MLETIRTVPAQASLMAIGAFAMTPALSELPDIGEVITNPTALNAFPFAMNVLLAIDKLRLRNRVEGIIEEHGYDERIIRVSSISWCGRQATKIACERTGYIDEFFETVEDPEYSKSLSWLPHI